MANYIECQGEISQTTNGVWTRCRNSDGVATLTEQQFDDLVNQKLTPEQASELGSWIFLCCSIAYGGRLILKAMSYR